MTAAEFEKKYANEEMGCTVEDFRCQGYVVVICNCESEDCPGWHTAHPQVDAAYAMQDIAHSLNHIAGFFDSAEKVAMTLAQKYAPEEFATGIEGVISSVLAKRSGGVQ